MDTPEKGATETVDAENKPIDPKALAEQWRSMIETLVPPENVEVQDVLGNVYRLRSSLPASVETRVLRRLEGVRLPDLGGAMGKIGEAGNDVEGVLGGAIDGLAKLAGDEAILAVLSDTFALAHPKAVRLAIERARADEDFVDYLPEGRDPTAADVFSVAALISGIVPFAILAVRQITNTASDLLLPTS